MTETQPKPALVLFPHKGARGKVAHTVNRFVGWEKDGMVAVEIIGLEVSHDGTVVCVPGAQRGAQSVPAAKSRFVNFGGEVF